ncbi:MAG: ribonuclease P protein component [Candidatus Kerfeldbacteria bacterium]|nr:ribonuclease P protein component [Candidatus Kerfeldbacteria bacterium]
MLPALFRLRKKKDFDGVYHSAASKTLHTALFRIKTAPNTLNHPRFGIVVPNKLIKKAVERNKKRRQIRAVLGSLLPDMQAHGYDIILLGQPRLCHAEFLDIKNDLVAALTKIRFI